MKTDRELLELAAKAAGLRINTKAQAERDVLIDPSAASLWLANGTTGWNPLTDDGDALRLAVKLRLSIEQNHIGSAVLVGNTSREKYVDHGDDPAAATRRAIVRAAAAIWEAANGSR